MLLDRARRQVAVGAADVLLKSNVRDAASLVEWAGGQRRLRVLGRRVDFAGKALGAGLTPEGLDELRRQVRGTELEGELAQSEPVNRHRPAVDVLFNSAVSQVGANALGVILTGMGKDGAQGLLALRKAGAWTIGQDQESCVVYGMPREAVLLGGAEDVLSLEQIAEVLMQQVRKRGGGNRV